MFRNNVISTYNTVGLFERNLNGWGYFNKASIFLKFNLDDCVHTFEGDYSNCLQHYFLSVALLLRGVI